MMKNVFFVRHITHINLVNINPERTTQKDKEFINDLNYDGIKFASIFLLRK